MRRERCSPPYVAQALAPWIALRQQRYLLAMAVRTRS